MLSRTISVILCLCLVALPGSAQDTGKRSPQAEDKQETVAASGSEAAVEPAVTAPEPLSQEEEESLSERAEDPGPKVTGGALSNLHLTYAVIALAAIVLAMLIK